MRRARPPAWPLQPYFVFPNTLDDLAPFRSVFPRLVECPHRRALGDLERVLSPELRFIILGPVERHNSAGRVSKEVE